LLELVGYGDGPETEVRVLAVEDLEGLLLAGETDVSFHDVAGGHLLISDAFFLPPGSSLNEVIASRRTLNWVDVFLPLRRSWIPERRR
jgi:hypothetical protein